MWCVRRPAVAGRSGEPAHVPLLGDVRRSPRTYGHRRDCQHGLTGRTIEETAIARLFEQLRGRWAIDVPPRAPAADIDRDICKSLYIWPPEGRPAATEICWPCCACRVGWNLRAAPHTRVIGNMRRTEILLVGWMLLGFCSCRSGDEAEAVAGPGEEETLQASGLVPDFSLDVVNPASPFFGTKVSPRQFLGQVSAWYFGHGT